MFGRDVTCFNHEFVFFVRSWRYALKNLLTILNTFNMFLSPKLHPCEDNVKEAGRNELLMWFQLFAMWSSHISCIDNENIGTRLLITKHKYFTFQPVFY